MFVTLVQVAAIRETERGLYSSEIHLVGVHKGIMLPESERGLYLFGLFFLLFVSN